MARPKRKDKTRTVLRTGELQRSDGSYQYSWTDENHKRRYVYSKTLEALRIKEEAIEKDKSDGIKAEARYVTLDDLYELWKDLKRGLKNNTFENYKYIYETFVRRQIGSKRVSTFLKSDIKRFYNYLVDERGLKPATVDGVHNILHQIFDMAVDDNYIRNNPRHLIESSRIWRRKNFRDRFLKEIFGKLGLRICNSFADFSGKPSSDNDIQLMVYSIRE